LKTIFAIFERSIQGRIQECSDSLGRTGPTNLSVLTSEKQFFSRPAQWPGTASVLTRYTRFLLV